MRYAIYCVCAVIFDVIALVLSPFLILFASYRNGPINNNNGTAVEPRLPVFLSWFDTAMDNSLLGDSAHKLRHANSSRYWQMLCWLVRNHGYGFRWTVLAMPIQSTRKMIGNPQINHHTQTYGTMRITQPNGAWQYKAVSPFLGKIIVLNFGWLLDDPSQEKALFMLSPRIK